MVVLILKSIVITAAYKSRPTRYTSVIVSLSEQSEEIAKHSLGERISVR